MPYATMDDVQRRMPQFQLTPQSRPALDSAQVFLDDTHSQLDAALENLGYVIPITGAKSLRQVREIVCYGTIAKILYARAAAVGTDAALQSADRCQKHYEDGLKMLADPANPIELTDAGRTDDEVAKPGSAPMGLLNDVDTGERLEPRVTYETKW